MYFIKLLAISLNITLCTLLAGFLWHNKKRKNHNNEIKMVLTKGTRYKQEYSYATLWPSSSCNARALLLQLAYIWEICYHCYLFTIHSYTTYYYTRRYVSAVHSQLELKLLHSDSAILEVLEPITVNCKEQCANVSQWWNIGSIQVSL